MRRDSELPTRVSTVTLFLIPLLTLLLTFLFAGCIKKGGGEDGGAGGGSTSSESDACKPENISIKVVDLEGQPYSNMRFQLRTMRHEYPTTSSARFSEYFADPDAFVPDLVGINLFLTE